MSARTERRAGVLLVVAAVASMGLGLLVVAPRFMTVDDAKYIGIGANLLAGAGPTVFGVFFPYHSPLWPLIVAVPHAWIAVDSTVWAHALSVGSVLVIVSVAGYLGWRVRPLVGGIAAFAVVGYAYLLDLGRGMGLDLPASALTLLYLALGIDAIERRSIGRAVLAGLLFAVAFLIKEIALSFAPVPFLAAAVVGTPWRSIVRCAGATLLAALPGLAWWFVLFALETNTVYRLGTPAWTLIPLGLAALIFGIAAISVERLRPASASDLSVSRGVPTVVAWGLTAAWFFALLAFFALNRFTAGQGFVEVDQLLSTIDQRFVEIAPVAGFGLAGIVLLGVCRPTIGSSRGLRESMVALAAGLPLVLLVWSVGETPRHYIVQSVLLLVLGAAGWVAWLEQILERRRGAIVQAGIGGALLGLVALEAALGRAVQPRGALIAAIGGSIGWILAAFAMRLPFLDRAPPRRAIFLVGLVALFATASLAYETRLAARASPVDTAKATAVARTADWIRTNVPGGEIVAFEALLAYETAIAVQDTHQAIQIREFQDVQYDPTAPLGIGRHRAPPADDWIILYESPTRGDILYGYRAGSLEEALRTRHPAVWVLSAIGDRAKVDVADVLDAAAGVQTAAAWSMPYGASTISTTVMRIDPAALDLDGSRLVVTPAALTFLVDRLERLDPSAARPIAVRLLARVVVTPAPSGGSSLDDRLRRLAGE